MPLYTAYQLTIASDVAIPELATAGDDSRPADIQIRRVEVDPALADRPRGEDGQAYRVGPDQVLYVKDGSGRFLVRGGCEIGYDPEPGAEDRVWRLSLFGPALGLLLIQRGLLVLHGGAVVCPGGVVLLLGPGGMGKSTLTGELCRQGGGLLTDDVVAIDMEGPVPLVLPGVPLLKLWPDAVDDAPEGAWTEVLHPDFDKVGRRMDDSQLASAAPAARIYILAGGEGLARTPLSGAEAFRGLMAAMFAVRYGDPFVAGLDGRDLLTKITRLLTTAPVEVLQRPRDRRLLAETAAMVMASARQAAL